MNELKKLYYGYISNNEDYPKLVSTANKTDPISATRIEPLFNIKTD